MKKVILIKYGELTTKKDNRNFFIKTLKKNIFHKLSNYEFEIIDDYYRMFIIPKNDDFDEIVKIYGNEQYNWWTYFKKYKFQSRCS